MKYNKENLKDILKFWNLDLFSLREDFIIAGSPERTDFRVVVETNNNDLYLLENFSDKLFDNKDRIVKVLNYLQNQGLNKVNNYIQNQEGQSIYEFDSKFWQLQKFILNDELDRKKYIFEEWRGEILADWLIGFKKKSQNMPFKFKDFFSLKEYIYQIYLDVQNNDSQILPRLRPIVNFLEDNLLDNYENLPLSFCHGDYHPLNIIWSQNDIQAVIDWEFCGLKPEMYDIANMISCVGMENPRALTKGLISSFIQRIKKSDLIRDISWQYLVDLMIAIRFAWLAEWLRKKDLPMIDLELDYMYLLKDNYQDLKNIYLVK